MRLGWQDLSKHCSGGAPEYTPCVVQAPAAKGEWAGVLLAYEVIGTQVLVPGRLLEVEVRMIDDSTKMLIYACYMPQQNLPKELHAKVWGKLEEALLVAHMPYVIASAFSIASRRSFSSSCPASRIALSILCALASSASLPAPAQFRPSAALCDAARARMAAEAAATEVEAGKAMEMKVTKVTKVKKVTKKKKKKQKKKKKKKKKVTMTEVAVAVAVEPEPVKEPVKATVMERRRG